MIPQRRRKLSTTIVAMTTICDRLRSRFLPSDRCPIDVMTAAMAAVLASPPRRRPALMLSTRAGPRGATATAAKAAKATRSLRRRRAIHGRPGPVLGPTPKRSGRSVAVTMDLPTVVQVARTATGGRGAASGPSSTILHLPTTAVLVALLILAMQLLLSHSKMKKELSSLPSIPLEMVVRVRTRLHQEERTRRAGAPHRRIRILPMGARPPR